jgi:hypothetical protein
MRPHAFHGGYSLRQLRHQGVLQAVSIIKAGYPHRISYHDVHTRYAPLLAQLAADKRPGTEQFASVGPRDLVSALLAAEQLREGADYVLGRTRVFLRLGKAQLLESMLSLPPSEVLPDLERRLRAQTAKRAAAIVLRIALYRAVHRRRKRRQREAKAALAMQAFVRTAVAKRRVRALVRRKQEAQKAAADQAAAAAAQAAAEAEAARSAAVAPEHAAARWGTQPPHELGLDPALHKLVFAHWDWAAPGAGGGASARSRRPHVPLAGRGADGLGLLGLLERQGKPASDEPREGALSARLRAAAPAGGGAIGWALLALLVGAYAVVAALPVLHVSALPSNSSTA